MSQLQKGQTFTDGEQVTGVRLNQLVDASTLQTGAITEQGTHTPNTVASDDLLLVFDASAGTGTPPSGALVKTQASSLLASNLPVVATTVTTGTATVPVINSSAGSDLSITAYDGTLKTGKAFASTDGILVTVTDTSHGLVTGQIVTFSSASNLPSVAYNGTYSITKLTDNTFTYTLSPTSTAASGTISYQKKATNRVTGNETISGELKVAGNTTVGGNLVIAGSITQSGGGTQTGNITQTGTVTQSGAVNQSGTVNITGTIQYGGTPVFGMYEIVKYTTNPSPALTKGADEIWLVNAVGTGGFSSYGTPSLVITGTTTIYGDVKETVDGRESGGSDNNISWSYASLNAHFIIPTATTFASKTFDGNWQVITITKYKTA